MFIEVIITLSLRVKPYNTPLIVIIRIWLPLIYIQNIIITYV